MGVDLILSEKQLDIECLMWITSSTKYINVSTVNTEDYVPPQICK